MRGFDTSDASEIQGTLVVLNEGWLSCPGFDGELIRLPLTDRAANVAEAVPWLLDDAVPQHSLCAENE